MRSDPENKKKTNHYWILLLYAVVSETPTVTLAGKTHFTPTRTRQDCLILSCPCRRCEQKWRQVKTVDDRKFRNCFVQSRNAARTTENSLDLSPILFTPPTRQYKTVFFCPCRRCELGIKHSRHASRTATRKTRSLRVERHIGIVG